MQYISIPANTTYPLILGDEVSAMNTAKIYLLCDTSSGAGAINILLPRITNGDSSLKNWWFEIFINDIGNNASVNNIKITPNPADKINGSGAQITLSTNGVTGRIVVTSKTGWDFNVASSSSGGGGVNIEAGVFTRTVGEGSGVQTIATTKKAKLIFFNAMNLSNNSEGSQGQSNGVIQSCMSNLFTGINLQDKCITLDDGGSGFSGVNTAINNTSFDITWTIVGSGINMSVQWYAITE